MVDVRVITDHTFRDGRGKPIPKKAGEPHRIVQRKLLNDLVKQGVVELLNHSTPTQVRIADCLPSYVPQMRFGFFCNTSKYYSGGRLHLYQYAWALAEAGADIWFFTDRMPIWANDYPKQKNIRFVIGESTHPPDLDVLVTDAKQNFGIKALQYREAHPNCRLVVMNFETPNWVKEFNPQVAKQMQHTMNVCKQADMIVCNSDESAKYLNKYMTVNVPVEVLKPAANNLALAAPCKIPLSDADRAIPFVVYSARGSAYKRRDVALKSVKGYKGKLNLVCIGAGGALAQKSDKDHKIITFPKPIDDAQKMWLMKHAKAVIAPSEFEGFGMVPAEALCAGTPVVVFDLPVLRQNYGDLLVYSKWKDGNDFAEKLHNIIDGDPDGETEKAEKGKPAAAKAYGMEAIQKDVLNLTWHTPPKRAKVTAQMICYYGPTVQEAIESIYEHADEIKIAFGPTQLGKGFEAGNTRQLISDFVDVDNKIEIKDKQVWKNKHEMRSWCASRATGNRMLIFDADEIYSGLDEWINSDMLYACPKWVHFWHDIEHYVVDASGDQRWGKACEVGCYHNHYRYSYWKPSYRFAGLKGVRAEDARHSSLAITAHTQRAAAQFPNTLIYHMGHALDKETMTAKHDFYLKRDGADAGRKRRKDAWHNWNGELGNCGDGIIKKVDWEVPELVKRSYAKLENK